MRSGSWCWLFRRFLCLARHAASHTLSIYSVPQARYKRYTSFFLSSKTQRLQADCSEAISQQPKKCNDFGCKPPTVTLEAAAMVKLTPKLISIEFPNEDPQSMQKLVLPGKGIEKVNWSVVCLLL